jgi:hypothetical protein
MELILLWVVFAVVVGIAAGVRGRSGFGWFILSLLLSPLIGLILVLVLPNKAALRAVEAANREAATQAAALAARIGDPISEATHTRCPDCREAVRREAVVCKHCGRKLEPSPLPEVRPALTDVSATDDRFLLRAIRAILVILGAVVAIIALALTGKYFGS